MKTAVEWLQEALMTSENAPNYNQWAFNKAKEMEKEQIIEAYGNVCFDEDGNYSTAEKYYNETFKTQEDDKV